MARTFQIGKQATPALLRRKAAVLARLRPSPDFLRASYVKQYLKCGKANCRCHRGFKHGPFYYLVQCLGAGKIRKFLLKTSAQRTQARAGIAAHLKFQRRLAELSEINTELLRRGADGNGQAESQ
jgi:hypothetical protein